MCPNQDLVLFTLTREHNETAQKAIQYSENWAIVSHLGDNRRMAIIGVGLWLLSVWTGKWAKHLRFW